MEDLGLPRPRYLEECELPAHFNTVFVLTFLANPALAPAEATEANGATKLFLRAANPEFSGLVATEIAVLSYLKRNTTIPVPLILRYDDTANNALRRRFTLLQKVPGVRLDQV